MSAHANGPFDVKLTPLPPEEKVGDPTVGRMAVDKQYHGDLEATSKGQMLTASTNVNGSAGYVAIERVTGSLRTPSGIRSGSFTLQHSGTMTHGTFQLNVIVVPDSGTGQLAGLTGKMTGNVVEGKHSYEFDYTLP
jgi:primosomal replication protein N